MTTITLNVSWLNIVCVLGPILFAAYHLGKSRAISKDEKLKALEEVRGTMDKIKTLHAESKEEYDLVRKTVQSLQDKRVQLLTTDLKMYIDAYFAMEEGALAECLDGFFESYQSEHKVIGQYRDLMSEMATALSEETVDIGTCQLLLSKLIELNTHSVERNANDIHQLNTRTEAIAEIIQKRKEEIQPLLEDKAMTALEYTELMKQMAFMNKMLARMKKEHEAVLEAASQQTKDLNSK